MPLLSQFFKNDSLTDLVAPLTRIKRIKKGHYFLKEGMTNRDLAIISKGLLQSFVYKDGKEITTYISGPGKIITSISSFLREKPTFENIRALSDAELLLLPKASIEKLIGESEDFKNYYLQTLEELIVCIDQSRLEFITLSADQRYEKLIKEEPQLFQLVSLKHIANMIGITERHLTRIRKNQ